MNRSMQMDRPYNIFSLYFQHTLAFVSKALGNKIVWVVRLVWDEIITCSHNGQVFYYAAYFLNYPHQSFSLNI